jgi:hypothetical protein
MACDLASVPALLTQGAGTWLDASPVTLQDALREKGFAFTGGSIPNGAIVGLCENVTTAVVVFDDPPEEVFALLTETERHGAFMRDLDGLIPVSRAPEDHVDRHEIRILFTRIVYHTRHHWDEKTRRIWWDLSPNHSNDLSRVIGYWELYPLSGGRSLGFYGTAVDVGPVIPKRMQAAITKRKMYSAVRSIRAWVDREGDNEP